MIKNENILIMLIFVKQIRKSVKLLIGWLEDDYLYQKRFFILNLVGEVNDSIYKKNSNIV